MSNKRKSEMERELERSLSEKSFSYRIRTDKSVDDVWKKNKMRLHKILSAYLEEEVQQNEARHKVEGRKKRRERQRRQRTKLSSRRENELLCEIGRLVEKLEVENKFLEDRIKKHLKLESDRDLRRPAEAEREQLKLRATELEFLEREMMMNREFAEREKAWERERERLEQTRIQNERWENWMKLKLEKMEKEIEDLKERTGQKKEEEKTNEPEKKWKSFSRAVCGWMDKFRNVFRRF